jgi:hypothetical protein
MCALLPSVQINVVYLCSTLPSRDFCKSVVLNAFTLRSSLLGWTSPRIKKWWLIAECGAGPKTRLSQPSQASHARHWCLETNSWRHTAAGSRKHRCLRRGTQDTLLGACPAIARTSAKVQMSEKISWWRTAEDKAITTKCNRGVERAQWCFLSNWGPRTIQE